MDTVAAIREARMTTRQFGAEFGPRWRRIVLLVAVASMVSTAGLSVARAQSSARGAPDVRQREESSPTAVGYGPETIARYRFGVKLVAAGAPIERVVVLMAVPLKCPEQEFRLLDEDATQNVESVEYRQTDEGVRQMVITIRDLPPDQEAHAYSTFEVRTRTVLPPRETATLAIPKHLTRELKPYLAASPMIDVKDRRIRAAVDESQKTLAAKAGDTVTDWLRVEAMYDYALQHVSYQLGDDKSSVQALADGKGDCQAIAATFVAMCRTFNVPARMVWVAGHQYAEFYLESAPGTGAWYPIESAGTRSFGAMPLARVILQKGDNIRVPERRGERLRYASDIAVFASQPRQPPTIAFVREPVSDATPPR
jgi:hypothetical protein